MIYFIGAGPGDPELITVKGKNHLEKADIVIYTGSLINKSLLDFTKATCKTFDSSSMTLEEVLEVIKNASSIGLHIVRLHTGDPSIFGAIREQIDQLCSIGLECEVIPGVSSFLATAAALKKEYTLPGVTQTVILTRMEGRTDVPPKEKIELLAKHNATMIIFLSVGMIDTLVDKLKLGYCDSTKIAVVYKASWPDQKIVEGTLNDIVSKVHEAKIIKTALVVVGDFLGDSYELSKLYDKGFSHEFRIKE